MRRIRDVLVERPRLLLVGINPGLASGAAGYHFAAPVDPFWRLLHASGLIPVPLLPAEEARLAEFGVALTNLCPRVTRTAAELTSREIEAGRRALDRKIARLRPRVVAFVGLSIYRAMFPESRSAGAGLKPETIHGAAVFALPSTSGLNAAFPGFQAKLVWFRRLARSVEELSTKKS